MKDRQKLLGMVSKKYKTSLTRLIDSGRVDVDRVLAGLESTDRAARHSARQQLARQLGVQASSRLRLKKPVAAGGGNVVLVQQKQQQTVQKRNPDIPLSDLFQRFRHENKTNQFQTLSKLAVLNKTFRKIFKEPLERLGRYIKVVVSLCHFFDLTRRYPTNTFQQEVGDSYYLVDENKIRKDYRIFLKDNQFHLTIQDYSKTDFELEDIAFPNTKQGFIQLLDQFVPILKTSVFALNPYWSCLRPLTAFDKQMLKRFRLVQDDTVKQVKDPSVFKINPQTIAHWDMSYLNYLSDDYSP
jgi:hypothetical protein